MPHLPRLAQAVGECVLDFAYDLARSRAPPGIVIGDVMRCREQPAQRNILRYAIGTGQRADRKALAVEGRLLLPGRCVADAPTGVRQSCGSIGVLELGRNLSACLAL